MKQRGHQNVVRYGIVLSLFLSVSVGYSDTSDWVQVERFKKLQQQAEAGKVTAMYDLARAYERGKGTDINYDKAVDWYAQASEVGFAPAKARLGILYFEGRGVKQDHKKAHQLLSAAAVENVPSAQYQLALMYEWGTVVKQDREKALFWYRKAAKAGDYRAQDKVKQLSAKRTTPPRAVKKKPQTAAKQSKTRPTTSTLNTLMQNKWTRAKKPTPYLPSEISECQKSTNAGLHCMSRKQQRKTRNEVIVYDIEASLSNFKNSEFTIEYVNTIVEVQPLETIADAMDETDSDTISGGSRVKVGQKSRPHTLNCRLLNNKHVRCTRDGTRTYDFHS